MITARRFRPGQLVETVQPADISEVVARDGGVVWADVVDPGPDDLQMLATELGLHPLALEDA
ncbi:MAG TPA: hypothetical protein VF855_04255, partial [Acidimicrobiales bacterium]